MAEWSNAVVLKTIVLQGTGGSNPSLSAFYKRRSKQSPVSKHLQGFFLRNTLQYNARKRTFLVD